MGYLFEALNPWWTNKNWDQNIPKYERHELQEMIRILTLQKNKKSRAPILIGPRRVGKTTLLYQLVRHFLKSRIPASNILYYSFERADFEIQHNPKALTDIINLWGGQNYDIKRPRLLLLDEIQNVKDWDSRMKTILEASFQPQLLIVMTGSSSFDLLSKSIATLFGVTRKIYIPPFSLSDFWMMKYQDQDRAWIEEVESWRRNWFSEEKGAFGLSVHINVIKDTNWKKALNLQKQWLNKGGFPEFWQDTDARTASEMFDFYVRRVVEDDILRLRAISQVTEVARFLKYCYFHPGAELNVTTASQELGIPRSTLDIILDLVSEAGYIHVIPKYSGDSSLLRQRHVKIYPIDHGLIPKRLRQKDDFPTGMTLETMVLNTFLRIEQAEAYFYRKKIGQKIEEIDFIFKIGKRTIAVEVKKRATRDDLENFRRTVAKFPKVTNKILIVWDTDEKGLIKDSVDADSPEHIEVWPLWVMGLGLPTSIFLE